MPTPGGFTFPNYDAIVSEIRGNNPASSGGRPYSPAVAATIQGEAGSNPAGQFGVASTIYNRLQAGGYGSSATSIVNAPNQYLGRATPNANAIELARSIEAGDLYQYGNPGNAVQFRTAGSDTTIGRSGAPNIGGNQFSDTGGAPSPGFVPPQYGATSFADVPSYSGALDTAGTATGFPAAGVGYAAGSGGFGSGLDLNPAAGRYGGMDYTPGGSASDGFLAGSSGGAFNPSIDLGSRGSLDMGGSGGFPDIGSVGAGTLPYSATTGDTSLTNPLTGAADIAGGTSSQGDFFQNLINILGNFFTRGGLVILGVILLGVAAWGMVRNSR